MRRSDRQPLSPAVALVILIYAVLAPMLINSGIADNGDFSRSMQWFIEKPAAFPTNWPSDDATWDRRFTKFWIDEWTPKPDANPGGMESRSSAQILNMAGIAANAIAATITGSTDYSLRIASIPPRIVQVAAFAGLAVIFYTATASAALTFGTMFFVSAVLLDVSYQAFFNSFYEERASLLYLTVLVPATAMAFGPASGWGWKLLFSVALALFASSKAQFAPTPAILLAVFLVHAGISALPGASRSRLLVMTGLFLVPQVIALAATSGYEFRNVNAYNATFLGALTFSEDPALHLEAFPPDAARCIGVNAFVPGTCFTELGGLTSHGKVVSIYLNDLPAMEAAIRFASGSMQDIALDAYGKKHLDGLITPVFEPALWTGIKGLLPTGTGFYVLALALSGALLPISRVAELRALALSAQFLSAIGVSQTVITVIGDGRAEIAKHLLIANFAFDLALVLTVGLLFHAVAARSMAGKGFSRRLTAVKGMPGERVDGVASLRHRQEPRPCRLPPSPPPAG
jgi:hypothetical protein